MLMYEQTAVANYACFIYSEPVQSGARVPFILLGLILIASTKHFYFYHRNKEHMLAKNSAY